MKILCRRLVPNQASRQGTGKIRQNGSRFPTRVLITGMVALKRREDMKIGPQEDLNTIRSELDLTNMLMRVSLLRVACHDKHTFPLVYIYLYKESHYSFLPIPKEVKRFCALAYSSLGDRLGKMIS